MFSEIPNKKAPKIDFSADPYKRDLPSYILHTVPVSDIRLMNISWVIPDYKENYQSSPLKYLTRLRNISTQLK